MASEREHRKRLSPALARAQAEAEERVSVYLVNGTRTSGGTGPGVVSVPRGEAARLVADKLAVYGETGPQDTRAARTGLRS